VGIEDEASDLVILVGDHGFVEEALEWQIGEGHLRGDPFLCGRGADSCQLIAGAGGGGAGEHLGERRKGVVNAGDGVRVGHCG
jgi:hypothetical protein